MYYTLLYEPGLPPIYIYLTYIPYIHTYIHVLETRKQKHSQPTSPTSDLIARIPYGQIDDRVRERARSVAWFGIAGRPPDCDRFSCSQMARGAELSRPLSGFLLLHQQQQHHKNERQKETLPLPSHPHPHSRRSYITSQHTST